MKRAATIDSCRDLFYTKSNLTDDGGATLKAIRIGCGSGGCTYERMEPAVELAKTGRIDYLVFECLAERTIADAQRQKLKNPQRGYNPMLQERMEVFLPLMQEKKFKIISNMGGANPQQAVFEIMRIALRQNLKNIKIAMVTGDDITERIDQYRDLNLFEKARTVGSLENIISANVYLGADSIRKALDEGADVVITGRVADPSLFVGPILHEFHWKPTEYEKIGQAILTGHLLECCTQLTGGYYADPGYKEVPDLYRLGHPIAEINENGELFFTKTAGSGGLVSVDTCKEQLLYEIGNPACYITPDGIADFSRVAFEQIGENVVAARGAISHGITDTYKANIGYLDGFMGVGEVSFGGRSALERAKLIAGVIQKRWDVIQIHPLEAQFDYIGFNSLYKTDISRTLVSADVPEVRLRVAVRAKTEEEATRLIREVQCLYVNGAAGSSGITARVSSVLSIENVLIPRAQVVPRITYLEM